jgi:hypothetical protein
MSEYNWCHNPDCHKIATVSRIRGSKGNKVLRTVKIKETKWNEGHIFRYFCNNNCLFQFLNKFGQEIANTYSVKQPSETPIKDPYKTNPDSHYPQWNIERTNE